MRNRIQPQDSKRNNMTTYPSARDAPTCTGCPFAAFCPIADANECPTVGELAEAGISLPELARQLG